MGFTRDRDDANDLVQETFVKALRYKNNFKEGTNIKGWLYTIMRNIFINNYKRKRFQNTIVDQTENQYFLNSGQDYHHDSVTSLINIDDIQSAISRAEVSISAGHSPCSSTASTTTKSQRNWASRWAR